MRQSQFWTVLVFCFLLVGVSRAQDQKNAAWTDYFSNKWNFCAAFPTGWQAEELFFGDVLKASPKGSGGEGASVTLGAFRNQHGEGEGPAKPLEAIAEDAEDDLRDSMVKNVQSHDRSAEIAGLQALVTNRSYLQGTEPMVGKEVRVRRNDGVIIELMLRAPKQQFEHLQSAFDSMLEKQFKPSCTRVPK